MSNDDTANRQHQQKRSTSKQPDKSKFWTCLACRMPRNRNESAQCVKCWATRGMTEKFHSSVTNGQTPLAYTLCPSEREISS